MALQIQLRRGTASEWSSANPVLAEGELGVEKDTGKFKLGNGSSQWNSLLYSGDWSSAQTGGAAKTANYTLLTADVGDLIMVDASTNVDITVDNSLNLATRQRIDLLRLGTGEVTVVADNATVNGTPGLKLRARYSAATLLCVGADDYVLLGDLKA